MTVHRVTFEVDGAVLVGHLHRPNRIPPHPGLVVAGPMTSVKEQVTGRYAAALAKKGFAAFAIDHRGFGESAGAPRQYEHHGRKVADLRAALALLARRPDIDAQRIGIAGVCLGAGYAAHAAIASSHVKAVGFIAGYYRDPAKLRLRDPDDFDRKIAQGRLARLAYEISGDLECIPAVALDGDAAMLSADTYDYYARRAAVPNYTNALAVMSREHFLPFDVQVAAPALSVPVLMVHSHNALAPQWARSFYAALRCQKTLRWVASKGQTDFYDEPRLVNACTSALATHFRRTFARTTSYA